MWSVCEVSSQQVCHVLKVQQQNHWSASSGPLHGWKCKQLWYCFFLWNKIIIIMVFEMGMRIVHMAAAQKETNNRTKQS